MQLGLFGEVVPLRSVTPKRRAGRPKQFLDDGGTFQTRKQSNQDAVAAITELYQDEQDSAELARLRLTGQATADLREAALGAASIAGSCLRALDQMEPGLGANTLRRLALSLAQYDGDGA